jgi:hypothetical protein
MYNMLFLLPSQNSWMLFRLSSGIGTRIISILRTKDIEVDEWRHLRKTGTVIGPIGQGLSNLWEWTLTFRGSPTQPASGSSPDLQWESDPTILAGAAKSQLRRFLRQSWPLAR